MLAGIGFTLVWGILGGSMPRSGGPYIYNSRILHPLVGIAQSFGDALIWLWWIGTLAPLAVDPGLVTTFEFLGWNEAAAWLQQDYALFIVASVINVTGFLLMVFGITVFARAQRVFLFVGTLGAVVMGVVFTVTSQVDVHAPAGTPSRRATTRSTTPRSSTGSTRPSRRAALRAGCRRRGTGPTRWASCSRCRGSSPTGIRPRSSAARSGGPSATCSWAQLLAVLVPFVFIVWIAWALYHSVGFEFLSAASWNDYQTGEGGGVEGYALPWTTSVFGLVAVATESRLWPALVGLAFVLFNVWWVALSYLAFPRTLFAWGMDRIGPRWFTDINPRFASPVKNGRRLLRLRRGAHRVVRVRLERPDAEHHAHRHGDHVGVRGHGDRGAALPVPASGRAACGRSHPTGAGASWVCRRWCGGLSPTSSTSAILLYALVVMKASTAFQWFTFGMFVVVWILGIAWYLFWRDRSRIVGVDVRRTYDQLPPE